MPELYNIGSLNIDWVYTLPHVVRPGETLASTARERFAGGKGANQSVAAARAGQRVHHVGCVGADGRWLRELLEAEAVGVSHLVEDGRCPTGHAVIQVDARGENAIFLFPGANHQIGPQQIDAALGRAAAGDWVLTQNETGNAAAVLAAAAQRGLKLVLNPSPVTADLAELSLDAVHVLVVNETEAAAFTPAAQPPAMVRALGRRVGGLAVLTLGAAGVVASDGEGFWRAPACAVDTVADTTAAGDTFAGYLVAALMDGQAIDAALRRAAAAGALAVTRPGAIPSIPAREEVDQLLDA